MDDSDRLSVLRQQLCRRLGTARYDLWFGAPDSLQLDGKTLRIRCASALEVTWLRGKFSGLLAECAALAFGFAPQIVLEATAQAAIEGPALAAPSVAAVPSLPPGARRAMAHRAHPVHDGAKPSEAPPRRAAHRPQATFGEFVIGGGNRLAVQAAREAAQQPGRFSPLLIYGPTGCGKSHLAGAIAHEVRSSGSRLRVLQVTAEQFTSQFLEALDRRGLPGFRQKTRSVDVLVLDDVQFLSGKRATLEELLYTLDALQARGGQAVLTSEPPASDLQAASPELGARLASGLAVALDPPDCETRTGIVRVMAARMRIALEAEVVDLVAQRVVGSARLLSGALNRLVAASMAAGKPVTLELAEAALGEFCRQHAPHVRLADIQRAVCDVFGVEAASLKSQRKCRAVAEPRMLAMWLARRYTRAALSEIGDFFGRSHSTVVSAQKKFDRLIGAHGEMIVHDQLCPVEEAVRRIEARLRTA